MITLQKSRLQIATEPVAALTQRMVDRMIHLWWSHDTSLPDLGRSFTDRQQAENEKQLSRLLDGLTASLKRMPKSETEQAALRSRILDEGFHYVKTVFEFEERHIDLIRRSGFVEITEQFARMARAYDPAIRGEDIYQASRNVMTMNFMQLLLGLPVEMTPSVFAYSMLYPYTDNYLDDPAISLDTKMSFNRRFWQRLSGESVQPSNAQEERIWDLVQQVEGQYQRSQYPQVYESLLAIHAAQSRSLRQLRGSVSPYEVDVLRISFEKGGTSVLADGYLVAGALSEEQAAFMFGYGAFTQLMDDMEDVEADRKVGFMTLFSQTAGHWPLDAVTNRVFRLGAHIFGEIESFPVPDAKPLHEMISRVLTPLLCVSATNLTPYYSRDYMRTLEKHMPFRAGFLRAQQKKLDRNKVSLMKLMDL
jgi:hypothetical protein